MHIFYFLRKVRFWKRRGSVSVVGFLHSASFIFHSFWLSAGSEHIYRAMSAAASSSTAVVPPAGMEPAKYDAIKGYRSVRMAFCQPSRFLRNTKRYSADGCRKSENILNSPTH